jgi:hypothetical protein
MQPLSRLSSREGRPKGRGFRSIAWRCSVIPVTVGWKMNGNASIGPRKVSHSAAAIFRPDSVPYLSTPEPVAYVVINSGLTADWTDWAGDFSTPQLRGFRGTEGEGRLGGRKSFMRVYSTVKKSAELTPVASAVRAANRAIMKHMQ